MGARTITMSKERNESKEERAERKRQKKEKKEKKKAKRAKKDNGAVLTAFPPSSSSIPNQAIESVSDIASADSPFQKKRVSLNLSLLPASLHNTKQGIIDNIQSNLLLKYVNGINGVVLTFDNVQICKDGNGGRGRALGKIINEMPYIHYRATCDMLVFEPSPGKRLCGVVNESSPSHIGLLVLDIVNVTIRSELLREIGFTYNAESSEWHKRDGGGNDTSISIGSVMSFKVQKLLECNGLISLEGANPSVESLKS